jgi:hypothetical protein
LGITREEVLVAGALVLEIVEPRAEARWSVSRGAAGACDPEAV